jgi:hypothetical protein
MSATVATYSTYFAVSVALTVWVARSLSRSGRVFLIEVMHGNEQLADAVNRLLVVGFYLVNLGFVTLYLKIGGNVATARSGFEMLSIKLGTVLLVLGALHFANVLALSQIRRRSLAARSGDSPAGPSSPPTRPARPGQPGPGRLASPAAGLSRGAHGTD